MTCSDPVEISAGVPPAPPPPGRWYKGMPSPNKAGRPPGVVDKRTKVTQALLDDGEAIARVVRDAALEGDLQACGIVLSRIAPPMKPQADKVQFEFSPDLPLADQATQVLTAVADGLVDPDTGKTLIACIDHVAGIRAVEELDARLSALEAQRELR